MAAPEEPVIGPRARAARTRLGLNQSDVAERVGISNEVYGRFERGLVMPRLTTLMRLCTVLRVQPNDLLVGGAAPHSDSLSVELRHLVSVLEGADTVTVKRVTEVARWLRTTRTVKGRVGAGSARTPRSRRR